MALSKVHLRVPAGADTELPDIKYIGDPPALPITINPGTEEVEMSDKSKRLAFFTGPTEGGWREFTLGWGYLTKTELDLLLGLVTQKIIWEYKNDFEDAARWYDVYIVGFSYEFVRTGLRDLGGGRYRAEITLREV